jgi:hypothetical protein
MMGQKERRIKDEAVTSGQETGRMEELFSELVKTVLRVVYMRILLRNRNNMICMCVFVCVVTKGELIGLNYTIGKSNNGYLDAGKLVNAIQSLLY